MTIEGIVSNGMIILDAGAQLPEGARVCVELLDDDEIAPPIEPYDREKELAILRRSIAEADQGLSRPLEEVMAEIAMRHNLPSFTRK